MEIPKKNYKYVIVKFIEDYEGDYPMNVPLLFEYKKYKAWDEEYMGYVREGDDIDNSSYVNDIEEFDDFYDDGVGTPYERVDKVLWYGDELCPLVKALYLEVNDE